jgi:hypothetical protein
MEHAHLSRPQISASAQGKYRPRCPDILGPVEPGRLQVVVGRPPTGPTPAADRRAPVVAGARMARGRSCRSVARVTAAAWLDRRLAVQVFAGSPGLTSRLAEAGAACGPHPSPRTGGVRQRVTTTDHDNHPGQTAGRHLLVRGVRAAKVATRPVGQSCRSWRNNREAHRCRSLRRAERQGRQRPPGQAVGNTAGRSFLSFFQLLDWRL